MGYYGESRTTTLIDRPVKYNKVRPKNLSLGEKFVHNEYDKKDRLIFSQEERIEITLWGRKFICYMHNVNHKGKWFCFASVTYVGGKRKPLFGLGRTKRRAHSSMLRVLESYLFSKHAKLENKA